MPENIGRLGVDIVANTQKAEKTIDGFIQGINKTNAKFELKLDITEVTKSISKVEQELKSLSNIFTGDKSTENKINKIASSLDTLRNSISKVIQETSTESGKKESFLKVDFVDDFKAELNSLMPLIKQFYSAFNEDQIIALSSAFDKMSNSIEQMSHNLSLIVGKQGLGDLLPVDIAESNKKALEEQKKALQDYQKQIEILDISGKKAKAVFTNIYDYMNGRWTKDSSPLNSSRMKNFLEDAKKLNNMGVDFSKVTVQFQNGAEVIEKSYADLFNEIQKFGTDTMSKKMRESFQSIFEGMNANLGKGSIEEQLKSTNIALIDAERNWQRSKEVLETPMRVQIEDNSLKDLNKLITDTKNNAAGLSNVITIEGFNSSIFNELIVQLDKIVNAVKDVNLTLKSGINFNPINEDLEEAKLRMEQFDNALNDLGISKNNRKNIFGFDAIVKDLQLGTKSVQEAVLEVQEALKNGLSVKNQNILNEQEYINAINRIKENLLIQFPQIDFSNYTEVFNKIKTGSLDAVEALNQISNAERQMSVNVPVTSFGQEDVDRLKSLVGSLKNYLKDINKEVKLFSTDFNNSFEFTKASENLRLFLEETRQITTTMTSEFKNLGDAIVGSFTAIPDNTKRTISELREQITEVGTLIHNLLDEEAKSASDDKNNSKYSKSFLTVKGLENINTNKLNSELSSLSKNTESFAKALNGLENTLGNLKTKLETPLNININFNGPKEAEKNIEKISQAVIESGKDTEKAVSPLDTFIGKIKELKSLYSDDAKEIKFFSGLINNLKKSEISIDEALRRIETRYKSLLSGEVGDNSTNLQQKIINLKSLLNSQNILSSLDKGKYDVVKGLSDDEYAKKYRKFYVEINDFTKRIKETILTLDDGTQKVITDLSQLNNVDFSRIIDVKYVEHTVAKMAELADVANKVKIEMQEANSTSTTVDVINTSGLEQDQKEIAQTTEGLQKLKQEAKQPISPDVNTAEFQTVNSFIDSLKTKINELQGEGKEGIPINIKPVLDPNKINTVIPNPMELEINPWIDPAVITTLKTQLETITKNLEIGNITLPDNFTTTLSSLKTQLADTNTVGGRNLVEQIESVTAALALLDQIDLSNLNLAKAFNIGDGVNIEQLAAQLKTVSEAVATLSKKEYVIPDNIFGGLGKIDDTSAINSINFVTLAEGLNRLKIAFKDFPTTIPDLSPLENFLKTIGKIKFSTEAITAFNSLNVNKIKAICTAGEGNANYKSLGQALKDLKEGIVAINQLKKLPDLSRISVTKTKVDNLDSLAEKLGKLRKELSQFSGASQDALKSLSELAANLAGIKNIDKLLSLTPEKVKQIQDSASGKLPVEELNKQAIDTYDRLADATKRYYEAKEMLDMNPSVDAINKEQAAMEELISTYSKLEALEKQGATNAAGLLSKYNNSVDAYTSIPVKNLLIQQKKALEIYKESFGKVISGKATDYDRERLVEASNALKSIQEQINQLDIEDNALVKERNNLLSQQSNVEDKYYASLKEKVVEQKKITDSLINEIGPTPLTNELFSQMSEMVNLYSKISSKQLFGDELLNALKQFNDLDTSIKNIITTITKNTSFKDYMTQYKEAIKNYKSSMEALSKGKDDPSTNFNLVESYNKIVNLKKQINDLIKEGIQLTEQEKTALNTLSAQQSGIEEKYYSSLTNILKGYQSKYDDLFSKTGFTPLSNELATKIANMRKLISNISSGNLFGDDLLNAQQEFKDLENSIKELFITITNNPDIKNYMSQYKEAIKSYKSSMEALAKGKDTPTTNANLVESYNKIIALERQINDLKEKGVQLTDQEKNLLNQATEIRSKYADVLNGRLSGHETTLKLLDDNQEGKLSGYAEKVELIRKKFEELKTATQKVTSGDLFGDDLIKAQQEVNSLDKELSELEKTVVKGGKVIGSWSSGLGEIGKSLNATDAVNMMKSYVEGLKNAQVESTYVNEKAATLTYSIKNQSGEIQKVTLAWDAMTNSVKMVSVQATSGLTKLGSMLSTIGKKIKDISAYWMGMYLNPFEFLQRGKQAVDQVVTLDTAMVELQKTTSATQNQLNQFYQNSNNIAKEYGNTTADIISATADWSRMGYSLTDSENLAKFSSQFASISENLTVEDASNTLISVMKAYDKETSDLLDIMSKINVTGNNFAVTNTDIAEGLRQSASAMQAANSSLEENIAIFTAGDEIIRDASSVGSALKSISMRIRGKYMSHHTKKFVCYVY